MGPEPTPIIGMHGIFPMNSWSMLPTRRRYPWITLKKWDRSCIAGKRSLEFRNRDGLEVHIALLLQSIHILDTLVGEVITADVISAAWRHDALKGGDQRTS